ncbi:MAG TPA: hypothetical protein VNT99_15060, partial [Methylomirabilota bacterium]|nr:hypothetical protein [Methylomirabilota bacterium]
KATSVLAPRFETLVDRAELIFTGHVISQRTEWRNGNGQKSIVTLVSFAVQQVHKGRAAATVTLQFLGGTIGDVTLEVAEMPKFKAGERVVLFVEGNGVNASPIIGFFHGRFLLRKDRVGREAVWQYNGEPLAAVNEIGRGKRAAGPEVRSVSHEEFTFQIHQRVATQTK